MLNKLKFSDLDDQQLVDVRSQHDYQAGHVENALNLNPGNFKKYASYFIDKNEPIIFVVKKEDSALEDLETTAQELGFAKVEGYLLAEELPSEALVTTGTISAEAFSEKTENFILLDVRQPAEITRPAPELNLVNIPFEDLIDKYQTLDTSKEIYTLCGSGNRSTAAASFLESKGIQSEVIEGGMKAIQAAQQ